MKWLVRETMANNLQVGFGDFSIQLKGLGLSPESFGLPSLKKQDTPACDAAFGKRACTRKGQ